MRGFLSWLISGWIHSSAIGLMVLFAFAAGLDSCQPRKTINGDANIVPVDVVSFSDFSNVSAISRDPKVGVQPDPEGSPQPTSPQEDVEPIPDPSQKPKPKKDDKPKSVNLDDLQTLIDRSKKTAGKSANAESAPGEKGDKPRKCIGACNNLSANEKDLLRSKLEQCWRSNADQVDPARTRVTVRFQLNKDGSLKGEPRIIAPTFISPNDIVLKAAARNAVNAVRECAPFKGFRPERYEYWRDVSSNFGATGVE